MVFPASLLLLLAATLYAGSSAEPLTSPLGGTVAFGDIDGDKVADAALLTTSNISKSNRVEAQIRFTGGRSVRLSYSASFSPGHVIRLRDYDNDADNDIVIEDGWSSRPLLVWLNTQNGEFQALPVSTPGTVKPGRHSFKSHPHAAARVHGASSRRLVSTAAAGAVIGKTTPVTSHSFVPERALVVAAQFRAAVPIRGSPASF